MDVISTSWVAVYHVVLLDLNCHVVLWHAAKLHLSVAVSVVLRHVRVGVVDSVVVWDFGCYVVLLACCEIELSLDLMLFRDSFD